VKKAVIDTNVLVSATLSSESNPGRILDLIAKKKIQMHYSVGILDEYRRVLAYKKLNILIQTQEKTIAAIEELGVLCGPGISDTPLPDESDRIFYDTAKESDAILVTGNTKHYPAEPFIMTPADFLSLIKTEENL